jgi:hypothetical protein
MDDLATANGDERPPPQRPPMKGRIASFGAKFPPIDHILTVRVDQGDVGIGSHP